MKLAYFTNHYPKVSHSFIRREILALETSGIPVIRIALRCDEAQVVDEADKLELNKTKYILDTSKAQVFKYVLQVLLNTPTLFLKTLFFAAKLGFRSDRGLIRHLIYFVESCILLMWEKESGITHIHAHFGTNSTTVVMLARLMGGAEYSFTVHGPEEFDKPEFIHLAEKIKYSCFTVAISSFGKSQLSRLVDHELWDKIKIVHCGLDSTFLDNNGFHKVTNTRQLVCVGRLCEQKAQILLIDAMAKLRQAGVECHLVLAGDGEMREVIEQRIKEHDLEDLVTITGWVTSGEVKQLLLDSQAMVLPSFAEGLPVVIMEAMALHRPVISTYIAGIPELVINGENGYLVPAGDVEALACAMKVVLEANEEQSQSMSNAAYQAVKQQHDINTEAAKLAELFKQSSDYGTH